MKEKISKLCSNAVIDEADDYVIVLVPEECDCVEDIKQVIEGCNKKAIITERTTCEVWSRVMGYYRPVSEWNTGKQQEFYDRKEFNERKAQLQLL